LDSRFSNVIVVGWDTTSLATERHVVSSHLLLCWQGIIKVLLRNDIIEYVTVKTNTPIFPVTQELSDVELVLPCDDRQSTTVTVR